jgi:hypothetical protein
VPVDTLQSQNKELHRQIAEMHNEPPARTVEWLETDGKLAEVVALGNAKLGKRDLAGVTGLMSFYHAWQQAWAPMKTALWEALTPQDRLEALEKLEDDIHQAKLLAAEEVDAAKRKAKPLFSDKSQRKSKIERADPDLAKQVDDGDITLDAAEAELAAH